LRQRGEVLRLQVQGDEAIMKNCQTCGLKVSDKNAEQHRHDCLVWRGAVMAGADEMKLGMLFWKAVSSTERLSDAEVEWA